MTADSPPSWPWRSPHAHLTGSRPDAAFFRRPAELVARELLGMVLRSTVGGLTTEGVIVETEAYVGPHDPASHAAARIGRTARNECMFREGGVAYVYRSYGMHWCLNIVTGEAGFPAAVLIRSLDPLSGRRVMEDRREGRAPLCAGPGRLSEALGVTGELDGHSLDRPPLELLRGWPIPSDRVAVSGRVGIRRAAEWPLRFFLRGHPEVSRGPARRGGQNGEGEGALPALAPDLQPWRPERPPHG